MVPYDRQPLLGNDLKHLNLLPGSVYWLIFMTFTANSKCCWVYEFDSCQSEDVRKMIMELIHLIKAGSRGGKDLILGLGMHHWSTMLTTAKLFIYLLLRDHILKYHWLSFIQTPAEKLVYHSKCSGDEKNAFKVAFLQQLVIKFSIY